MAPFYRADPARRPEPFDHAADGCGVCRTFLCARCRDRVVICARCDRGQVYCANGCAGYARRAAQREAGRRYQQSRDGRFAHAERNRRYRLRRKNVTHQGSPPTAPDGQLAAEPVSAGTPALSHCHWCGCPCSAFLRQRFLRRRRVRSIDANASIPRHPQGTHGHHDHLP